VQATHVATAPILGYINHARLALNEQAPAFSQAVVDFIARKHIKTVILAGGLVQLLSA
jgi:hypothetical protein